VLRYIGGRLLTAVLSLAGVVVAGFFLFRILPGDPVRRMTEGREVTAEQRAERGQPVGVGLRERVPRIGHDVVGRCRRASARVGQRGHDGQLRTSCSA
jgi:ABC-type microcin C transport system permease subunit YejB